MQKLLYLFLFLIMSGSTRAQDIHFSQFYNSPLQLNPAMTGYFNGNLRAVFNHRSQWANIAEPFVTSAFSVDTRLFDNRLKEDAIGAGFSLAKDKSGPADLSLLKMAFSGSYFKMLGRNGAHLIALGVQAGIFQRWIDLEKLRFESQFRDLNFDPLANSGENNDNFNVIKPDFQTGVLYQFKKEDQYSIHGGFSFFHLSQPNESLLNELGKLTLRSAFYAGANIKANDEIYFSPSILIMYQNKAKEINIGGKVNRVVNTDKIKDLTLSAGIWTRPVDAIILLIGGAYDKWEVNFSYDINMSGLSKASNYKGGFEISIIYVDRWLTKENKIPVIVPCPRL